VIERPKSTTRLPPPRAGQLEATNLKFLVEERLWHPLTTALFLMRDGKICGDGSRMKTE
jgi:hypothetical protein